MTSPVDLYDAPLAPAEFDAHLRATLKDLDGPAGKEILEQIEWFLRRYPTPLARLRYARRKHQEAIRVQRLAKVQ